VDAEDLIKQTADTVRSALDEAQRRAQEIVSEAETQAERIRSEAEETAGRIRAEAEAQAKRRLEDVRSALDQLQGRLASSPDGHAGRGDAGTGLDEAPGREAEVDPGPVTVPEPEPPATPEPMPEPAPEPAPAPVPEPMPPPDETDAPSATPSNDAAARLVAMKLALDGASREDARKQLAADYDVADLDVLLDEVYSRAGH
jgi:outer membrane biosynthesis protein TonB